MFIQTAFSFSGVIQCLFCLFSGLRLHGLRRFSVFLASSPCVASASSYRFCSAVPPRWRSVFSRLAPVAKLAKFAQRAKNVKLALNSKITHLNSRSQSALASNILVQHIEQPMHRYLFLRLMD
ncbi:DUF1010 domain-containing protein [Klebsiella pneumoniae]